eukprot:30798-Pelagococcus_subviridis.AAC.2
MGTSVCNQNAPDIVVASESAPRAPGTTPAPPLSAARGLRSPSRALASRDAPRGLEAHARPRASDSGPGSTRGRGARP